VGSFGTLDKASATKEYTGTDCEIKSSALSDEQLSSLGKDAVLITYKATVGGTCSGQHLPTNSRAAAIYVRDDGKWKRAFHARAAIVDPKAPLAKPVARQQAPNEDSAQPTDRTVTAEAAGSSPVVPAILSKELTESAPFSRGHKKAQNRYTK
jgi:hypothetical protein